MSQIKLSRIHTSDQGVWWALGTPRQWVEIRATPTGLLRIGKPQKGPHPYFTINEEDPDE